MHTIRHRNATRHLLLHSFLFCSILVHTSPRELYGQDFSERIGAAAKECAEATVREDFETLMRFTYPGIVELLDSRAGGKGKGLNLLREQMGELKKSGITIDSVTVGATTPHVIAGDELIAIVPTVVFMKTEEMFVRQESYMIAASVDSGTTWTFVNGSNNIDKLLPVLFPDWNDELQLPQRKEPELIPREKEEE